MMQTVDGVILAGGRGQRMGGADKGLLLWEGRPMVSWVAQALRPHIECLWISANRNSAAYTAHADAVIPDALPNSPGPLAGLHAAAERSQADWLLVAPCDMPLLSAALFAQLLQAAVQEDGHLRTVLAQGANRLQPSLSLLSRRACLEIPQRIQMGQHRLLEFVLAQNPITVSFSAEWARQFENLNSPADQQRLRN